MASNVLSRLAGVVARFVSTRVNDAPAMQAVQGMTAGGEVIDDDTEHYQPYGFTAKTAPADADGRGPEAVLLAPGGDPSQALVICVADRRYRLRPLADGEVALYDDLGQKVHLTRTGIVIHSTSIDLGTGATKGVNRVGDAITSAAGDDGTFWTWIGAVATATGTVAPTSLTGVTGAGSAVVQAVD